MATKRRRRTSSRARPRTSSREKAFKNAAAAVVGGATGAMVGGLLVRAGVKPTTAAVGVTVAGAVAASTMKGMTRLAAGGAAAAGAGQLALTWLASHSEKQAAAPALPAKRNLDQADVDAAFDRAREELSMLDEASRYADGEVDYVS
jgi:hypothetical protein